MVTNISEDIPVYRLTLAGDSGVGKTSLFLHITGEQKLDSDLPPPFYSNNLTSHGFGIKMVTFISGKEIKLQIFDTDGRLRYRQFYFMRTKAVLLLFDVSSVSSLESVCTYWVERIMDINENTVIYLIGMKSNLIEKREISRERAQYIADELGLRYFEATNYNVDLILMTIAQELDEISDEMNK